MDIDVDQADPRGDLHKINNGKYFYKIEGDRFEIDRFNRDFDQYKYRRRIEMDKQMAKRLAELNRPRDEPPIYKQPIGIILIRLKDNLFGILDDILRRRFTSEMLTKDNRLFHIGITLLFIAIFVYVWDGISKWSKS